MSRCLHWVDAPDVARSYAGVVSEFGSPEPMQRWACDYARQHSGRVTADVDFLLRNYQFRNCLNIGGAPFLFEYLLKRARPEMEVVSADLDPQRFPGVGRALGIRVVRLDIEQSDPAAMRSLGRFECVVFAEIFEHLRRDLIGTVSALQSLLTDGGILYLTTPNGNGLYALWNKAHGRTGSDPAEEWSKLANLGHMGHVREYSAREVRGILAKCGFQIERELYRRGSNERSFKSRAAAALKGVAAVIAPALSDELVFVARPGRSADHREVRISEISA